MILDASTTLRARIDTLAQDFSDTLTSKQKLEIWKKLAWAIFEFNRNHPSAVPTSKYLIESLSIFLTDLSDGRSTLLDDIKPMTGPHVSFKHERYLMEGSLIIDLLKRSKMPLREAAEWVVANLKPQRLTFPSSQTTRANARGDNGTADEIRLLEWRRKNERRRIKKHYDSHGSNIENVKSADCRGIAETMLNRLKRTIEQEKS